MRSTPTLQILLLHILVPSTLSTLCLHHQGCFHDDHLLLNQSTAFHSYDTKRNAENCARLCIYKLPSTEIVLVKLEGVDKLLSCGCGGEEVLGNRTGLTLHYGACYMCPDSEREKCGGDATTSVYSIDRTGIEECTNRLLYVPPPMIMEPTTTTTTEEPTYSPEEPPEVTLPPDEAPMQTYRGGISDTFPPSNQTEGDSGSLPAEPQLPNLRYLGCYDEVVVDESMVVTRVVKDGGYGGEGDVGVAGGVKYCADNCTTALPTSADVFLLKVLSHDVLYCGCGRRAALPSTQGNSTQCDMRCGEGLSATPLPCGGWMAVSAYESSGGAGLWAGSTIVPLGVLWSSLYLLQCLLLPLH